MPELPEVETVKRTLNLLAAGKTIERAEVRLARIIQHPDDIRHFEMLLAGQTIERIERSGKFLRFLLDDAVLISHLRMEGRYGVYESGAPEEKHTHVVFYFTDGSELRYKDVRQFGTMHVFPKGSEFSRPPLNKLGMEPLSENFTFQVFLSELRGRSTKIKPLLLNQQVVAGLGNIYTDEALFRAQIHPERAASSLKRKELERLYEAIRETLREALDAGGSSIKSYVNGQGEMGMFQQQLRIYGRKEKPCLECGNPVMRIVVAGRGTHLCTKCQRLPRKRTKKENTVRMNT